MGNVVSISLSCPNTNPQYYTKSLKPVCWCWLYTVDKNHRVEVVSRTLPGLPGFEPFIVRTLEPWGVGEHSWKGWDSGY